MDRRFAELARSFVLVQIDSDNGTAKEVARLFVHRNRAYVLFLDYKGRETVRMIDPQRSSFARRRPWELERITDKMEEVAVSRPIGRSGA